MGYHSNCMGFVKPAGSLEELVEALVGKGFTLDENNRLYDRNRDFTGFVLDEENQELAGYDESVKTYGFDNFVAALRELSPLLAEASFTREGQDRDDTEGYEFDGSRWYVAISTYFLIPIDQKSRGLDRLEEIRAELKQL